MAWPIWLAKLYTPSRTATTRSRRWPASQRSPSAIWVRIAGRRLWPWPVAEIPVRETSVPDNPVLGNPVLGNPVLGNRASSAAEPANEAASSPKGSAAAAANSRLPAGGPRNDSPTVRLTSWLPLALGRSSGGTRAGSTDWAALLKTTSAQPRSRPATPRTAMSAIRKTMRIATAATTAACTAWERHMSVARS